MHWSRSALRALVLFVATLLLARDGNIARADENLSAAKGPAAAASPPLEKSGEVSGAADAAPPAVVVSGRPASERAVGGPPPASETGDGFFFGSYGRVGAGSDGKGHEGYATNVVSHGSRLEEQPYVELDLYYGGKVGDGRWRVVVAPAFGGDLFHYTGSFSSHFALRNAYVESEDLGLHGLRFWAGSRMYRGDDLYLFDYWPLDNLNTIGAGAGLRFGDNDLALHVGMNRQDDPFQYQTQSNPPHGLGPAVQSVVVDRQRVVSSAKYTRYFLCQGCTRGMKLSLYGELHYLPDGQRPLTSQNRTETVPSEWGGVIGAQLGMWLRPYTFANLFFRYATGIGVYGDLGLPPTSDPPRSSAAAREITGALSINYESSRIGIMGGAYLRGYNDPDPAILNPRSYVEGTISVRPQLYIAKWFHVAVEASYQKRALAGFDPYLNRRLAPEVVRFSAMPIISPTGTGTYARPMIYAVYTLSLLNQDARDTLFDPSDVRYGDPAPAGSTAVHYIGIGAEWWFQSSYR